MILFIWILLCIIVSEFGLLLLRRRNLQKAMIVNAIASQVVALISMISFYIRDPDVVDMSFFYIVLGITVPLCIWFYYTVRYKKN